MPRAPSARFNDAAGWILWLVSIEVGMGLTFFKSGPETCDSPGDHPADSISSRAGFLPIPLAQTPVQALVGIPVYIRPDTTRETQVVSPESFTLFSAATVQFDDESRQRLMSHGVKFLYIPTSA